MVYNEYSFDKNQVYGATLHFKSPTPMLIDILWLQKIILSDLKISKGFKEGIAVV